MAHFRSAGRPERMGHNILHVSLMGRVLCVVSSLEKKYSINVKAIVPENTFSRLWDVLLLLDQ